MQAISKSESPACIREKKLKKYICSHFLFDNLTLTLLGLWCRKKGTGETKIGVPFTFFMKKEKSEHVVGSCENWKGKEDFKVLCRAGEPTRARLRASAQCKTTGGLSLSLARARLWPSSLAHKRMSCQRQQKEGSISQSCMTSANDGLMMMETIVH